jgi:hypothetical protein
MKESWQSLSKRGKLLLVVIGYLLIISAIIFTVLMITSGSEPAGVANEEIDSASTEELLISDYKGDDGPPGVLYVGFEQLMDDELLDDDVFTAAMTVIEEYAQTNDIELARISYVKDSFIAEYNNAREVVKFTVVLNIDQQRFTVRINNPGTFQPEMILADEMGGVIYEDKDPFN